MVKLTDRPAMTIAVDMGRKVTKTKKDGNFSLRKEFAPRGSEFFPLREVSYGMENRFYHIR